MENFKYIILGAGPAGLTFANRLLELGETSFLVLEKDAEAGGLCKSEMVDGSPLDTGGGHFLDVKNEKALAFVFKFMPKAEWTRFRRISTITLEDREIDYPFESNIWQFPVKKQLQYLISVLTAGCMLGKPEPKRFMDWIHWKLGDQIARDYMIPYNEKVWSVDLNTLGTYWLNKLPNLSPKEIVVSCIRKKTSGNAPAHANFYYPNKFGYGEVWKRMANKLGNKIRYNTTVRSLHIKNRTINGIYRGKIIITTIPWKTVNFLPVIPDSIRNEIDSLEYSSMRTTYYPENVTTRAHWTYVPDKSVSYHRRLYRSNFCNGARGYWTETNEKRAGLSPTRYQQFWVNAFAYPLNLVHKPTAMKKMFTYFSKRKIFGLGRWGEWEHMNSDVAVSNALTLADTISNKHHLQ